MIVHCTNVTVTISISRDFFTFLAKRGTLRAFLDQAKNLSQHKKERGYGEKTYFMDRKPQSWILSAVTWGDTEQGHDYWAAEHCAWQRYISEELQKQNAPSNVVRCLDPIEWNVVE